MNHSETLKELGTALAKFQAGMKAVPKTKTNPFFHSKYADLSDVIDHSRKLLAENGLSVIQGNEECEGKVIISTMLLHTSGEWIESKLPIPLSKNDAQGCGAAITYGRRFALAAILGISSDEDDDGNSLAKASPAKTYARNSQEAPASVQGGGNGKVEAEAVDIMVVDDNGLCIKCHAPISKGAKHASNCEYK